MIGVYENHLMCLQLLLLIGIATSVWGQCNFSDGQCTYNINLEKTGTCTPVEPESVPQGIKHKDDSKMVRMQQDFDIVKADHENRIKELESSIQKVLRNSIPSGSVVYSSGPVKLEPSSRKTFIEPVEKERDKFKDGSGNLLLLQLQNQFNRLRTSLTSRTTELLDVKNKLNETIDLLTETQRQNFEASSKLVNLETSEALLKKGSNILKNKLKSKTERLEVTEEKLNASTSKLTSVENQLYDVVRSEALIKEELETLKLEFRNTQLELEELKKNHSSLTRKYEKTKTNLEIREIELIECYTAKTQTFCDFEDPGICGFKQDRYNDTFDWERKKGRTPSANTGPDLDHTCRAKQGHYMYVEASGRSRDENANLISPHYRGLSPQCLQFYYHMYGRHTGTLTMHTKLLTSDDLRAIWRVFGNQGNLWIKARVTVPEETARSGYQIGCYGYRGYVYGDERIDTKVIISANTELGYEGDISIDDFRITDGRCPNDASSLEVTPSPMTEAQKKETFTNQIERYRKMLRKRMRERRMRKEQ